MLAHQSGLYHIRQMIDRAERMLDWDYMVRAIERAAPVHEPGTRTGYHGLTYGFLVGELVQRVTGKPFSDVVREVIAEPLGLDGLYIGAPPEQLHRAAQAHLAAERRRSALGAGLLRWQGPLRRRRCSPSRPASLQRAPRPGRRRARPAEHRSTRSRRAASARFDFGAEETLRVAIPAANGLFTARSLARMYAALAGGGALDGVRLLSRETLARATEVQPTGARPPRHPLRHALAPRLPRRPHDARACRGRPSATSASAARARGPIRGASSPSRFIVNSGMGTPFGDLRMARISGAALACANARAMQAEAAPAASLGVPSLAAGR